MCRIRLLSIVLFAGIPSGLPAVDFMRGDVDGSGRLAVPDAIRILLHLFRGDPTAVTCEDAADVDDSGAVDVADAIHLLSGLFLGGAIPAAPFPTYGPDPTEDALDCEDAIVQAITYFGVEFSVDGLFFVMDKSSTMGESGAWERAKSETERLLLDLPGGLDFAIIVYDSVWTAFPEGPDKQPAESTEAMKAAAVAFLRSMSSGTGTCAIGAMQAALGFAWNSSGRSPALFYVTDGGGSCHGADESQYLERLMDFVTTQNRGHTRIHTFQLDPGFEAHDTFLEELAVRNGGTYSELPPP
jgi:hypothetical protein